MVKKWHNGTPSGTPSGTPQTRMVERFLYIMATCATFF